MGRNPPNIVGSKSPIARSSILRSPSAVRIFVPFRKQFAPLPPLPLPLPLLPLPLPPNAFRVVARDTAAADANMGAAFTMLRRVRCAPRFSRLFVMFVPFDDIFVPYFG